MGKPSCDQKVTDMVADIALA